MNSTVNPTMTEKELRKANRIPSVLEVAAREVWRDKFAFVSFLLFLFLLGAAFIGGNLVDADYVSRIRLLMRDLPPSEYGPWGTDNGGRCMFNIMLLSARNSFAISFTVTPITLMIGYTTGLFIGYYGGYVDLVVMRIIEFFVMVPTLMIIIFLVTIIENYGVFEFVLILIFTGWFAGATGLRARVLQESARDYVSASKTLGTPNIAIIFKKVLPNVTSFIMVGVILGLAGSIGLETGLTVIGYGLPFGVPSIGRLIALGMNPIVLANRPWQWMPAALLIFLMTLAIYGFGLAISRAVNPRQRR